ncbi:hypothetical protein [Arthrobacter wenxiniae]|jgi:hypothetical protein|uniref:Uncharacterized protein n=1 Tax=Arthrobacter wenxiniae TaxID=2713570 RepID=A0A7Y7M0A2_9MICC|nr:hypothetical protein [Arthrobacter wenxiniae]NVM96832.1 hypothetical protein [Arthrobacter wenxiniae]
MTASSALCSVDLEAETAELLPRRETLFLDFNFNVAPVIGVNLALALNAATIGSVAHAGAWQNLFSMH